MSNEMIGDGIIDPLYKDRKPGEELPKGDLVTDGMTKIESVLDIVPEFRDSFEQCLVEEYNEK